MSYNKKLIEVALPLDAINAESARGKVHSPRSPQHSALVVETAASGRRRPRAQMVDDPSAHPDKFPTDEAQQQERERLFHHRGIDPGETSTTKPVLEAARRRDAPRAARRPPRSSTPLRRRLHPLEAASRSEGLRQRPQPGGRTDQQGADRDAAQIRRQPPVNPENENEIGNSGGPALRWPMIQKVGTRK